LGRGQRDRGFARPPKSGEISMLASPKKLTFALILALVAFSGVGVALADTETGSGIVGTQSP